MPVVLAGVEREMGGNGGEQRSLEGEDPVQLGEAEVVADRQADRPALDLGDDRLLAVLLGLRLAVGEPADLDIEEVDLPVRGGEIALRVEDETGVGELLA